MDTGNNKKNRRNFKRFRGGKEPLSVIERASRIVSDLRAMGIAIGVQEGLSSWEKFPLEVLTVPLTVQFNGQSTSNTQNSAKQLVREVDRQIGEALRGLRDYRLGHVYCFHCEQPDCSHSAPEDTTHVFAGYTANGKPLWIDFVNFCMESAHPKTDMLYADPPEVIAIIQGAQELKGELLPSFGQGSVRYNLLGQVVAGLIPFNLRSSWDLSQRFALTLQVVETQRDHSPSLLRLNMVGISVLRLSELASDGGKRGPAERLRQTFEGTKKKIDSLSRKCHLERKKGYFVNLEENLEPILLKLKNDLEQIFNPSMHRTKHAQKRHLKLNRPTGSAIGDARKVTKEKLMYDVRNDTIVVLGPKGRAHIFSMKGRHVTSIQLEEGELKRKSEKSFWRPPTPQQQTVFLEILKALKD